MMKTDLNILIACEESQRVANEFRARGFNAFSCDIQECSGGHPEYHIQGDAIEEAYSGKYDLMIAFPPCTYLAISGNRHLYNKDGTKNQNRWEKRFRALEFVVQLMDAPIEYIAIENPVSYINSQIRQPDQIIHPYQFGEPFQKRTCLWLKNLPKLKHTKIVDKGEFKITSSYKMPLWYYEANSKAKNQQESKKNRSKTFKGIAAAMAEQWGYFMLNKAESFGSLFDAYLV